MAKRRILYQPNPVCLSLAVLQYHKHSNIGQKRPKLMQQCPQHGAIMRSAVASPSWVLQASTTWWHYDLGITSSSAAPASEWGSFLKCLLGRSQTNQLPTCTKAGGYFTCTAGLWASIWASQGFVDTAEFLQDLLDSRATICHSGHSLKLHTDIEHINLLLIIKDNYPVWQIYTAIMVFVGKGRGLSD